MSERRTLTAPERRVIKSLKDKIKQINASRNFIIGVEGLGPEDSPYGERQSKKVQKQLRDEKKELNAQTKSAKKLIKRVKAGSLLKARGGGGTGPVRTMLENLQDTVREDRKKF
jgi:hypothetical protein